MTRMLQDPDQLQSYIGRRETRQDAAEPGIFHRAAALFDQPPPGPGAALPELWHWFLFPPEAGQSLLGPDGHPAPGGFLPDLGLPRRMWGGSGVTFHHPLHIGAPVARESVIEKIDLKPARSGHLGIIRLRHSLHQEGRLCLTELQDLVYREAAQPGDRPAPPQPGPHRADRQRLFTPDPVFLFRYSALTWNAHRIHYDRPWATGVEGYRDLVVHGPLTATLLAAHGRETCGKPLTSFRFRGLSPLFCNEPLSLNAAAKGPGLHLWASGPAGGMSLTAEAEV